MSGFVYLDFEFNRSKEPVLNLVCCSTTVFDPKFESVVKRDWWLHNDPFAKEDLREYLEEYQDKVFVAYSAEAEARSMMALGMGELTDLKWIDLFLEYRMFQNHDHKMLHGKQLIDGAVKETYPYGEKGKQNLAAACYKLLGTIIDTDHKEKMRQLIISDPAEFTEDEKHSIMLYCRSDVEYLPALMSEIRMWATGIYRGSIAERYGRGGRCVHRQHRLPRQC